jgi:hypothetical protein
MGVWLSITCFIEVKLVPLFGHATMSDGVPLVAAMYWIASTEKLNGSTSLKMSWLTRTLRALPPIVKPSGAASIAWSNPATPPPAGT